MFIVTQIPFYLKKKITIIYQFFFNLLQIQKTVDCMYLCIYAKFECAKIYKMDIAYTKRQNIQSIHIMHDI